MKSNTIRFSLCFLLLDLAAAPQAVLISSDSLRGDLSFLASDLLEGRDTPSRGLDLAAEYIAAQFRRTALQPVGDNGYFQTAHMLRAAPADDFELRASDGSRRLAVSKEKAAVVTTQPLDLSGVRIYKVAGIADLLNGVKRQVVALDAPPATADAVLQAAIALHPAALLQTEEESPLPVGHRLVDPDDERQRYGGIPRLIVRDRDAVNWLRDARAGDTGITVSIRQPASNITPVTVRNVAGLLRGSDHALRGQYILLTAHYDHLGRADNGAVFPGANDDASGVVSVIEIARALAGQPVHPRRSILFLLFFGEEEGGLGSRYYTAHPLLPLAKTVADLNLEQLGRTDSNTGPEVSTATLTGFHYSNVPRTLQEAGKLTGVKVYETPHDDDYFTRSDNLTFAEHGIPAHTLVVAFDFPDYHATGDVWQKIDYGNMAKVDRMIAQAVVLLANSPDPPHWNNDNPNVARYAKGR
ncbi:MAG TPA: M20/M25/M40 family metallo-hydrolase [Bryobacteraceae bacterium]|nr:M20/M25/M40 family metallo-hydrolase [Bryobacteraceae bacterium]